MSFRRLIAISASLALLIALVAPTFAAPAQEPIPEPPFRFLANAFAMGAAIKGTSRVEITITRWSTEQERDELERVFLESGQAALVSELQKLPEVGRARVGTELSYPLQYASARKAGDKWIVVVATDRDIGPYEAYYRGRTLDYPLSIVELHIGDDGKGEGVAAVGVQLKYDRANDTIIIENYDTQPVRLKNLRMVK